MMTTSQAAATLNVSTRRVQELIKAHELKAEKASGVWLIDEASVHNRLANSSKRGGRPRIGSGKHDVSFTLMNRTHEVVELVYDTRRKEFTALGSYVDLVHAPLGLASNDGRIPLDALNDWWRGRGIPHARQGLAALLCEASVSLPQELIQRNLGLSLSDQYWIRPKNSGLIWERINFFNNDFEQVSLDTAAYAVEGKEAQAKPDNTSDGNLEKHWICRNGVRMLLKSGTQYGQEPYNEVVASALHRRLLAPDEYVTYALEGEGATAQSCCANFLTDEEEFVPAVYVERHLKRNEHANDYEHYLSSCEALGAAGTKEALGRMIVCDDVIANHDRHHRNFGIVRNVNTLECHPAPIFDSGSSLWCDVATSQLAAGEHSFASKQFYESPTKQMLLVDDTGWFNAAALDGFIDEAAEILVRNEALSRRLPYIESALRWRLERMRRIAEWD